jgi:hypothetical protein
MDDTGDHRVNLRSQFATPRVGRLGAELKRKIFGEPLPVATVLFVQPFCGHTVQRREVRIEDHPNATNRADHCVDLLDRNRGLGFLRHWRERLFKEPLDEKGDF